MQRQLQYEDRTYIYLYSLEVTTIPLRRTITLMWPRLKMSLGIFDFRKLLKLNPTFVVLKVNAGL